MRFITDYPYATTAEQNAQSIRNICDGMYDGQHDVNFNSATIGSAYISNLIVGSGIFSAGSIDFTRLSGVTIYAQSGNFTDSTFGSSLITSANITSMTLGYSPRISAATIYGTSGNFLYASLASASITTANIGSAYITSGTFVGLSSTTGTIGTLGSTSATIQTLQNAGYGNFASAAITTANITSATIGSATITSGNFTQGANIGSGTIQTLQNPIYGSFASANITTALIASATITSATITGAKIGTLQGLLLGTTGTVSAVASGTTAQYLRGDVSMQTLNQAAVAGLTTSDSPTFNGLTVGSLAGFIFGSTGSFSALSSGVRFKAGSFSRDYAAGNGTVAYSGVGFVPGAVAFFASVNGNAENMTSFGWMDASGNQGHVSHGADAVSYVGGSGAILMHGGGTDAQSGAFSGVDADGFTLGWTKSGTPAGTIAIQYIAIR